MATKRIPIASLKIGMYVCGVDRPWMETPFLVHRFLIKHASQIAKLKQCGIREVEIDLQRGIDLDEDIPEPSSGDTGQTPSAGIPSSDETEPPHPLARIWDAHYCETLLSDLPASLAGTSFADEFASMHGLRASMLEEVADILHSIRTSGVVQGRRLKDVTRTIIEQTLGHEEACLALIRTRQFSPDLYDHCLSVGTLAVLLGRLIEYDENQLHTLAMAALMHDIGLLKLPRHLLAPQARQAPSDDELFQAHPAHGVDMLKASRDIPVDVLQIVNDHHASLEPRTDDERADAVNHMIRLLRVVDTYDELLSGQESGSPLPVKDALRELYLRSQRNELDQAIVTQLISQVGIYPIYSLVELNTGERGIVTAQTPYNLLQPIVLLIEDADRRPLSEPILVRFSTDDSQKMQPEIVNVLDPEREGIQIDHMLANWVAL